ncbi:f0f57b44-495a-4755-9c0e-584a402c59e8 [Thermothielavioides terrestris]|uniref:F0f57b44-495a-4755-9c0e-584a402c59e8 n=1 Tax=Thermothielavioides terrestris TaxID=2587410 RepID=A0A3S4AMD9_9PEZI|nr:f0f57b44-495a-4755-9c0e-584a402c59e8 [Thermothielavioides terrestris]
MWTMQRLEARMHIPDPRCPQKGWDRDLTECGRRTGSKPTFELLGAGIASTRWLDLLAADAAQADSTFSLVQTPAPYDYGGPNLDAAASIPQTSAGELQERLAELANGDDRHRWQAHSDIQLQPHEVTLFRLFAEKCASWLDVFDPLQHFSTYVTRIAMRNEGLMKAILALSARYAAESPSHATPAVMTPAGPPAHINLAMQYYYETLHYVSTALHQQSYAHSEELLATALVISTYEMLDAARADGPGGEGGGSSSSSSSSSTEPERSGRAALSNWQRHLKGVFWIQRSQNVNGASGGLRQAVWWAWLQQDIWAAFRERRRCFSFWTWKTPIRQVPQHDLPALSMYLLREAVNYCADDPTTTTTGADGVVPRVLDADALRRRAELGADLMAKLDEWQACLGSDFKPLPSSAATVSGKYPCSAWAPIWVHPPRLAVALQAHSFARILVCLHEPPTSGFHGFLRKKRILANEVATICGLAMELTDKGCQIVSAQCLFGAGLCVEDRAQQDTILSLIDECEARCGWPMSGLREDLRKEWSRAVA